MTKLLHAAITDKAWRAYYNVYNAHGHDYPEAFFEEIMRLEFAAMDVACRTQVEYQITYKGVIVGRHITDMEIADTVVLELKVKPQLLPRHYAQLVSNLKISGKQVGLLLNFGSLKPEGARRILSEEARMPAPLWQPEGSAVNLLYPELTLALRQAVWAVYHELGAGFVYRVYANAMNAEMQIAGIPNRRLRRLTVTHLGRTIGTIPFYHFIVDDKLLFVPVASAELGASVMKKTRMIMRHYGLPLAMIANFANEKLLVKYVRMGVDKP